MPDLRLALRSLLQAPIINVVAVLSLALGIGANGAIFSLFDQFLRRPLPVHAPGELVNLSAPGPKPGSTSCNQAGDCEDVFSYPMLRDLQERQQVFTAIGAHRSLVANLSYHGKTLDGQGMFVSGSYFPLLGLQARLGRLLGPEDDRVPGEHQVVVLGYDYWRTRFEEDPGVLGEALVVNGEPLTIVGVAPAGFRGTTLGSRPEIFVPLTLRERLTPFLRSNDDYDIFSDRRSYWVYLFARLQPDVSRQEAQAALAPAYAAILADEAPLQQGMSEATMERFLARRLLLEDGRRGQSSIHEEASVPLILLFLVTGIVLLIACANVANLLLARSTARGGEIALRMSLGAGRGRLIGQLFAESLLLAISAGIASLLVAQTTLQLIGRMLAADAGRLVRFSLDWRATVFAASIALATAVVFGIFPAIESTRVDLSSALKGLVGSRSSSRAANRFRFGLVVSQIALSTMLLVAAGLLLRSLVNVSRVELGLDPKKLITFAISPGRNGYEPERATALFVRIEEELAALPGVAAVTASMVPVLDGSSWGTSVRVEGFPDDPDVDRGTNYSEVGPGYFATLGVPLLRGRELTTGDVEGAPHVAVVNEKFAEKFDVGPDPVGKTFRQMADDAPEVRIVGLVADTAYASVKQGTPPLYFSPYRQDDNLGFMNFYVRSERDPEDLVPAIARTVSQLDPDLPVEDLRTLPQLLRENLAIDRTITTLSAAFAGLATLLAAVGLYGVIAYSVGRRTREIGLRMAMGADRARIRYLILAQVGRLALAGAAIGLLAAFGIGKLAASILFEVEGHDPSVFLGALLLLGLIAFGAGLVPALRAARLAPMKALRYE